MPSSRSNKTTVPDWLLNLPIAHRGLHDQARGIAENSMSAFLRAKEEGLPIEFDVHLSSDQIPVVFHDANLERMTGDKRALAQVPATELTTINLNQSLDTIPTLESVLKAINGTVPLVIELKPSSIKKKLFVARIWKFLQDYKGPYTVQSFDPGLLKEFRKLAPFVIRGQLAMKHPPKRIPLYKRFMIRHMMLNRMSKPHYIGFDVEDIDSKILQRHIHKGMPVLAWTVSNETQLEHARKHADNIIFENLPLGLVQTDT